jgi:hypothetical protein
MLNQRIHEVPLRLLDRRRMREDFRESLHDPEKGWGVRVPFSRIEDAQAKLEHGPLADDTLCSRLRPPPRNHAAERLARVQVAQFRVERPQREHLRLEVLENNAVHARA